MLVILFILIFISPTCSSDSEESNANRWSIKDDQSIRLLDLQETNNCILDIKEASFEPEERILPQEIWWIIAVYSDNHAYKMPQLSWGFNGLIKSLIPHLVLPKIPSTWNILNCLHIIESCEETYRSLKEWGFHEPYFPAYQREVEKLTDAENYVQYSPLFRLYNGCKRLQNLREIHNLGEAKQPRHPFFMVCSSFARDPLISTLSAIGGSILTISGLAHLFGLVLPEYWNTRDIAHAQYLKNYQAALNYTTSESFPQSLKSFSDGAPRYVGINESMMYGCYSKCRDWYTTGITLTERSLMRNGEGHVFINNAISMPMDLCINPNTTSPLYQEQISTFIGTISVNCGQDLANLWAPWIRENLSNFTTTIMNIPNEKFWRYFRDNTYPGNAKIRNQSAFINVCHSGRNEIVLEGDTSPTSFCFMPADIYTYDPICIASKMVAEEKISTEQRISPIAAIAAWSSTVGLIWMSFMVLMILGWFV